MSSCTSVLADIQPRLPCWRAVFARSRGPTPRSDSVQGTTTLEPDVEQEPEVPRDPPPDRLGSGSRVAARTDALQNTLSWDLHR
eukprot:CAMPEP_0184740598 /NCGR_PEP_ID=MMETSP0315-20130426/3590_1 /TAXON_ID=101924 /ORGANISM="Rhodosorus marinus, Strain UTEX LB 2760" /LENGTH=83 /DNA_ID=CAMNT_0027210335 /DNA_START=65 /DNA_END=312 /DNA_ORIENTATION=-